jgi:hypothetical protein
MPFHAPAPVVNTQPCNDKQNCHYAEPCSDGLNCLINFAPNSKTPNQNSIDFWQKRCRSYHGQGQRFDVCRYCIASTEDEQWYKVAATHFQAKPPAHLENNNRCRYFLTRLCLLCEWREHQLQLQLQGILPGALPPVIPTQVARDAMAEWPINTCTCWRQTINAGVRCRPHRRQFWNATRPRYVEERKANRSFLVGIEQDAQLQRVPSTQATRNRRVNAGLHRACRCGADPVATVALATVMQCMGCEGIVHFGTPLPMPTPPAPHLLRQNSLTTPRLFAFL